MKEDGEWNRLLAADYSRPSFHISYLLAVGRRLRKNYAYILLVQAAAYYGKLAIHPVSAHSWQAFLDRAAVGPIPGLVVVLAGMVFHGTWIAIAIATYVYERRVRSHGSLISIA